jgi:multidrug efflux system membrane fusion protein
MKLNTSYVIAFLAFVVIGIWFLINSGPQEDSPQATNSTPPEKEQTLPAVTYQRLTAAPHTNRYQLYGRTEANRQVSVKAKTAGVIIAAPTPEGTTVGKGQILCQQDVDARQARVDQARAQLASAEFDLRSTRILVDKGYRSEIQLANLQAQLDGAKAAVKSAEIELENVNIRAPFKGMYERQIAEAGDYLAPGQPCGLLLELDPLIVAADLSESQLETVKEGVLADIELATGERLSGKVTLIESQANNMTRTFRTEITLPNPKMALRAGITATVTLEAGTVMAHNIPGRIMTLDENGQVGVRYLTDDNRVKFALTQTIDENPSGLWVTGLPDEVRIITQGQDFVSVGTQVAPRLEGATIASAGGAN